MTTHQRSSRSFLVGLALAPVVTFGAVAPAVADDGIPDVPIDPGVGEPGTPEPGDPGIDPGTPEEPPTNEIPEPPVDPGTDTGTPTDPGTPEETAPEAPAEPAASTPTPAAAVPAPPAPAVSTPAPAAAVPAPSTLNAQSVPAAAPVAAPIPSAFAQPAVPSSVAVPPAPATPTVAAPAPAAGKHTRSWAPAKCFTYTIVSGDTLSEIAKRYGVPGGWPALADANQDIIANPDLIFPGQNIRIPC